MNRPLSVIELGFYHDRTTPVNLIFVGRLDAPLPVRNVELAARRTQARHPLLRTRLDDGPRLITSRSPAPLPVEYATVSGEADIQDRVERELTRPFPSKGPLARVILLDGGPCSAMLVAADHTILDGRSVITIVRDLWTWVDDPSASLPSRPELPTMDALLPTAPPLAAMGEAMAAVAESFAHVAATLERSWLDDLPTPPALSPRTLGRWLDPELSTTVVERARAENVTVGALLVALVCTTLSGDRSSPLTRMAVATPIDVRPLLDGVEADDLGLYAWAPSHLLAACRSTDPWQLARSVAALVQLQNRPISLELVGLALRAWRPWSRPVSQRIGRSFVRHSLDYNVVVSNMGRVDIPKTAGPARLRSAGGFAWMPGFDLAVGTQAFDGRIEINLLTDESSRLAHGSSRWADELVDRLRAAVVQPPGEETRR